MTYGEIKQAIQQIPMTQCPALLKVMVETAISKGCFQVGKVGDFAKLVEENMLNTKGLTPLKNLSELDQDAVDAAWLEFKAVKPKETTPHET